MAERSVAEEKSKSSRLIKTFSVWGADEEFEVRMRIECNLTWPVKLPHSVRHADLMQRQRNYGIRDLYEQLFIYIALELWLFLQPLCPGFLDYSFP